MAAVAGDARAAQLRQVRAGLTAPLRVAIAGRLKAGKSTLVNALLGREIAETDVGECTKVVTAFRYGFPERIVIQPREGPCREVPLTPHGRVPERLGVDPATTSSVTVWLSHEALRELVVYDTPGLASAHEYYSKVTQEHLAIDSSSRSAITHADALVFVINESPRQGDLEALSRFRDLFGGIHASAANAVGVLGRADTLAALEPDPLAAVAELASRQRAALGSSVSTVIPVSGLWAQSARTGALTEVDAHHLGQLAALPADQRSGLLLTAGRFTRQDAPVNAAERERLLGLLGLPGVRRCLDWVARGECTAVALAARLERESGIEALDRIVLHGFQQNSDVLKADWALRSLERIGAGDDREGAALRDEVEALRLQPEMRRLDEVRVLHRLAIGEVVLPDPLRVEVERMATAKSLGQRLGAPPGATKAALLAAAGAGAARWAVFAQDRPRTSPAQERVARVMYRSYAAIREQLSRELQ